MKVALSQLLLALCLSLSCAIWQPSPAPIVTVSEPRPIEPQLDPRIAEIEARFLKHQTGLAAFEVHEVAKTVLAESDRLGLDPELVMAVIQLESGFYNFAISHAGAHGLMQLMPATGEMLAEEMGLPWNGVRTLFDPVANVRMGTLYLSQLQARYGDWNQALAAYNWGPGHIDMRLAKGRKLPSLYVEQVRARLQSPAKL